MDYTEKVRSILQIAAPSFRTPASCVSLYQHVPLPSDCASRPDSQKRKTLHILHYQSKGGIPDE
ncbi:MAG: hypothetical protein J6S92_06315, partial [Oscillospiraceae bacterium]|nr:hypothetical protein [Oscillospiraceae bacterium]